MMSDHDESDKAALALVLAGLMHGLRPDLPQDYLYDHAYSLVHELIDGDGLSHADGIRYGGIISEMAAPSNKGDPLH